MSLVIAIVVPLVAAFTVMLIALAPKTCKHGKSRHRDTFHEAGCPHCASDEIEGCLKRRRRDRCP
jgi:hypothetical protein